MNSSATALMGDLESIKALLEEDDDTTLQSAIPSADEFSVVAPVTATDDPRVGDVSAVAGGSDSLDSISAGPDISVVQEFTLDDQAPRLPESVVQYVDPTAPVRMPPEAVIAAEVAALDLPPASPLPALDAPLEPFGLDTAFHAATDAALARARKFIREHASEWTPQQTDDLDAALKVRIDQTVHDWVEQALAAHRQELAQRLVGAVRSELAAHLQEFREGSQSASDG